MTDSSANSSPQAATAAMASAVGENPTRPAELLAGVAQATWQSFNAMQATKQRHFELLEMLDTKRKKYKLEPTLRERVLLEHLLADHDEQVKRFAALSAELKATKPEAHRRLFEYIGVVNHAVGARRFAH